MTTIGILGGMGPRATVAFETMLLDKLDGTDQAMPAIFTINDGSIPDRSQFLLGRGEDPAPHIQHNLELLESMGAEIICLPCNTACMPPIFARLKTTSAKLICLPKVVCQQVAADGFESVCLLATEGTVNELYYQTELETLGINCLVPTQTVQAMVSLVIALVKMGLLTAARDLAGQIADQLEALGVDAVILGCTELPLVAEQIVPKGVASIDSLAVLADSLVSYSKVLEGETWKKTNLPLMKSL